MTVSYVVTNLGNVTVDDLVVDSPAGPVVCAATSLHPGASTTCVGAAHVVTSAEAGLGIVVASATASGHTAEGPVAVTASSVVPTVVDPVDRRSWTPSSRSAAPLATTGADTAAALELAGLLVGTGLVMVGATTFRRRRRGRRPPDSGKDRCSGTSSSCRHPLPHVQVDEAGSGDYDPNAVHCPSEITSTVPSTTVMAVCSSIA